jgi:omega-hydroxy-beta-dihydromenaquinone-9 sulfotransferase
MKHSYWLAGIKNDRYKKMKKRNGGISGKFIGRNFFLSQNSMISARMAKKEAQAFHEKIKSTELPKNPVFIVGHWRTGSTFLHQLLDIDPVLFAPKVFHVAQVDSFLVSKDFFEPKMSRIIGTKRPMDNVKIGFNEPQEDEYALLKLTNCSPLEDIIFPKGENYFLDNYEDFMPAKSEKENFVQAFSWFTTRLFIQSGKRIVFKNPFHSLRIPLLNEMFPEAKYIHIYRNPLAVAPSTINMWDIVAKENALKTGWHKPGAEEVAKFYMKLENSLREELAKMPENKYCQVKFEDFEQNPAQTVKNVYAKLGLDIKNDYENKINAYIRNLKNYKKNSYHTEQDEKNKIADICSEYMVNNGYK